MAALMCSGNQWVEIEKAAREKRRELVLQGPNIDKKIAAGGLDASIYSLSLLNYLEISQCPSLKEIHSDVANLVNLQSLILCRNKLSSVPEAVGSLKSLRVLDVSVNELTELPSELRRLAELNTLNVSCNRLRSLPDGLSRCVKLMCINISKNEITALPEDLFSPDLEHLSTIIASENAIEELNGKVHCLSALKNLDLSNNKLTDIPFDLADCSKLKEVNFRGNKLNDKRLEKMVNGCQTKSVLDYLRAGGRGKGRGKQQEVGTKEDSAREKTRKKNADKHQKKKQDEELDDLNQMVVKVLQVHDSTAAFTVKVGAQVKDVRPYIVCCVVKGMSLKQGNALKRFLMAQIKLHDEICGKRTSATIATHDLHQLKGPLLYDARPPKTLKLVPLGRKETTASELLKQLQLEAEEQRKQKKRQNVSGLHKYLQLLDDKENYPCLIDAEDHVISFPPITNSEKTKMRKSTTELLLEVTSATSLKTCKDVMDALIVKMAELNKLTLDLKEEIVPDAELDVVDREPVSNPGPEGVHETRLSELVVQQAPGGAEVYPGREASLSYTNQPNRSRIFVRRDFDLTCLSLTGNSEVKFQKSGYLSDNFKLVETERRRTETCSSILPRKPVLVLSIRFDDDETLRPIIEHSRRKETAMKTTHKLRQKKPAWSETSKESSRKLRWGNPDHVDGVQCSDVQCYGGPITSSTSGLGDGRQAPVCRPLIKWTNYTADFITRSSPLMLQTARRNVQKVGNKVAISQSSLLPPIRGSPVTNSQVIAANPSISTAQCGDSTGNEEFLTRFTKDSALFHLYMTSQGKPSGVSQSHFLHSSLPDKMSQKVPGRKKQDQQVGTSRPAIPNLADEPRSDVIDACSGHCGATMWSSLAESNALSGNSTTEMELHCEPGKDQSRCPQSEEYYTDQRISEWVLKVNASLFSQSSDSMESIGPYEEQDTCIKVIYDRE